MWRDVTRHRSFTHFTRSPYDQPVYDEPLWLYVREDFCTFCLSLGWHDLLFCFCSLFCVHWAIRTSSITLLKFLKSSLIFIFQRDTLMIVQTLERGELVRGKEEINFTKLLERDHWCNNIYDNSESFTNYSAWVALSWISLNSASSNTRKEWQLYTNSWTIYA